MADLPSKLADRRCPECGTLQPLFVRQGRGGAFQRGPRDVVACPGCGIALRLEADTRDPSGVRRAVVIVLGLTGLLLALAVWALEQGWDLGLLFLVEGVIVTAAAVLAMLWTAFSARRRIVVRHGKGPAT